MSDQVSLSGSEMIQSPPMMSASDAPVAKASNVDEAEKTALATAVDDAVAAVVALPAKINTAAEDAEAEAAADAEAICTTTAADESVLAVASEASASSTWIALDEIPQDAGRLDWPTATRDAAALTAALTDGVVAAVLMRIALADNVVAEAADADASLTRRPEADAAALHDRLACPVTVAKPLDTTMSLATSDALPDCVRNAEAEDVVAVAKEADAADGMRDPAAEQLAVVAAVDVPSRRATFVQNALSSGCDAKLSSGPQALSCSRWGPTISAIC